MPRLLRPHVPVEVKVRVALQQRGEMWPDLVLEEAKGRSLSLGRVLEHNLSLLAEALGCEAKDLHLDHDPALGARRKVFKRGEHVGYLPDANDPAHLIYRVKAAHRIKTTVRGEHGQLSDIALVKRNRRQEEREGTRPKSARTRMRERRREKKLTNRQKLARMFPRAVMRGGRKARVVRDVVRVRPSPSSDRHWLVGLECGHEVILKRASRPRKKTLRCRACEARGGRRMEGPSR